MISCEKEKKDKTYGQLGFRAKNYDGITMKSTAAEGFTFDSAYIVLEKIELKKFDEEEDTAEVEGVDEYDFYGPYFIDLIAGTSDPKLPLAEIEPGIYTKLEAEMAYFEEIGYSIYLHGTYTINGGEDLPVEFEYSYMQSEDFKVENSNGFEITAEMINNVWVMIDLSILIYGVNLSLAEVDQDNVIRLNKESNNDLADIIESNLEAASKLGLDEDDDGEIDD
jgi:hypothetical protein